MGNLPLETSFMDVIQHFEKYGEILECNIKEKKWNAFAFIVSFHLGFSFDLFCLLDVLELLQRGGGDAPHRRVRTAGGATSRLPVRGPE